MIEKKKIGLLRNNEYTGFYFIDLREKLVNSKRGYIAPKLLYKMDKPIFNDSVKEIKVQLEFSYKDQVLKQGFYLNFRNNYELSYISDIPENFSFNLPNTVQYQKFWYKPFTCFADYLHFSSDAKLKHKIEISHYYKTYLPNIEQAVILTDEGGCNIPVPTNCCGKICINLNVKVC